MKKAALWAGVLILSGCMYEPDHFSTNKVQVEEKPYSNSQAVSQFDAEAIAAAADVYRKHGDGPLELVGLYDPMSKTKGAMSATDEASRLARAFRKNGIDTIKSSILPVNEQGDEMKAMISYNSVSALPPKDCTLMPGMASVTMEAQEDYKLGCSVDTLYARQIASPKDLKGRGTTENSTADGRRASNIVDVYRSGVPNEPLKGESASDDN